ncbi:hypothetical protein PVNG_02921 [Plasmodium vivax North Korean]|uniref:Uncharacterized protein n=1 Tax=Plasmodium vivax North Korean TaxID=1035514 RepID=A0A0J9U1G6_PLAVI|nr:hypothetical protein PVNG_02921 [Plasmodium vivax North Korean]
MDGVLSPRKSTLPAMPKNTPESGNVNDPMKDVKDGKADAKPNDLNDDNVYIFDEPDDELEEFEEMGKLVRGGPAKRRSS